MRSAKVPNKLKVTASSRLASWDVSAALTGGDGQILSAAAANAALSNRFLEFQH